MLLEGQRVKVLVQEEGGPPAGTTGVIIKSYPSTLGDNRGWHCVRFDNWFAGHCGYSSLTPEQKAEMLRKGAGPYDCCHFNVSDFTLDILDESQV